MSSKLNVVGIITDHIATLENERTKKTSRIDLLVFFALPIALGVFTSVQCVVIEGVTLSILVTAYAIFIGFLINILILIYTLSENDGNPDEKRFLREIFSNISFCILVAILIVIMLSLMSLWGSERISSGVVLALTANFILSLLMAVKRIHIVLSNKFS